MTPSLTRVGNEDLIDQMDDAVVGHDVFFVHHFDSVHCYAVPVAPDLNGVPFQGLKDRSSRDGLRALERV